MLFILTLIFNCISFTLAQTLALATSPNFPSCPGDNGKLAVGYMSGTTYQIACGMDLPQRDNSATAYCSTVNGVVTIGEDSSYYGRYSCVCSNATFTSSELIAKSFGVTLLEYSATPPSSYYGCPGAGGGTATGDNGLSFSMTCQGRIVGGIFLVHAGQSTDLQTCVNMCADNPLCSGFGHFAEGTCTLCSCAVAVASATHSGTYTTVGILNTRGGPQPCNAPPPTTIQTSTSSVNPYQSLPSPPVGFQYVTEPDGAVYIVQIGGGWSGLVHQKRQTTSSLPAVFQSCIDQCDAKGPSSCTEAVMDLNTQVCSFHIFSCAAPVASNSAVAVYVGNVSGSVNVPSCLSDPCYTNPSSCASSPSSVAAQATSSSSIDEGLSISSTASTATASIETSSAVRSTGVSSGSVTSSSSESSGSTATESVTITSTVSSTSISTVTLVATISPSTPSSNPQSSSHHHSRHSSIHTVRTSPPSRPSGTSEFSGSSGQAGKPKPSGQPGESGQPGPPGQPGSTPSTVSTDGSCGTGISCRGSQFGDCCSPYGFCGSTDGYCGYGCKPDSGWCKPLPPPPTNASPDASCGGATGYTCEGSIFGPCCSEFGWCGRTEDYCAWGCQLSFGTCQNPTTPENGSLDGTCSGSGGLGCRGSPFGSCCSQWGYCGSTDEYCGAGCQGGFGLCGDGGTNDSEPLSRKPSPDASCGGEGGYTCAGSVFGECCSQWGWCGSSSAYCGNGCQGALGDCHAGGD